MSTQTTTSVSERALLLLEIIAKADEPPTLNELVAAIELPKATTHRFIVLLEQLGFAQRTMDGKRYEIGYRLTSLAIDAMRHSFQLAPRRMILSALVEEIGETCNVTMLDGQQLIYLDRVESDWPLQIRLKIGSRVPLHCTASGKLFLSLAPPSLRRTLFSLSTLERHTARTMTSPEELEIALEQIRKTRIGTDNEEFIDGMTAVAVPVMDSNGKICATVAVHGPSGRLPLARAIALAPALKRAAHAIEQTIHFPENLRDKKSAHFKTLGVTA
ncbi:MAG: IclR family transcriptional regulator [Xanthobacteraceae bacterium]|nr:IclR family transcriptional regulator [Xanthobacteraceae bacterium]